MILIDSCLWIALLDDCDADCAKAKKELSKYGNEEIVIDNNVYGETMTVFRNKKLDRLHFEFTRLLSYMEVKVDMTTEKIFELAGSFFVKYKKLSFIDSLLLARAKIEKLELVTFDKALMKAWEEVR